MPLGFIFRVQERGKKKVDETKRDKMKVKLWTVAECLFLFMGPDCLPLV